MSRHSKRSLSRKKKNTIGGSGPSAGPSAGLSAGPPDDPSIEQHEQHEPRLFEQERQISGESCSDRDFDKISEAVSWMAAASQVGSISERAATVQKVKGFYEGDNVDVPTDEWPRLDDKRFYKWSTEKFKKEKYKMKEYDDETDPCKCSKCKKTLLLHW